MLIGIAIYWVFYNSTTSEIRKINNILQKDRSVCDFINEKLDGWVISVIPSDGLRVVITPIGMPNYYLYITYNGQRPTNEQIKTLYYELTNDNSLVAKAHKKNIPYDLYVESLK